MFPQNRTPLAQSPKLSYMPLFCGPMAPYFYLVIHLFIDFVFLLPNLTSQYSHCLLPPVDFKPLKTGTSLFTFVHSLMH